MSIRRIRVALLLGSLAMQPATSNATDYERVAPGGGSFFNTAMWTPNGIPDNGDRAIFDLSSQYTVTFISGLRVPTSDRLRVVDDNVTFNLFGKTYTLRSSALNALSLGGIGAFPGVQADGQLRILNGTLSVGNAIIGDGTSVLPSLGSGTLRVSNGARFDSSGILQVGALTAGTLLVDGGGDVTSFLATLGSDGPFGGRTGLATVNGNGSTWTTDGIDLGAYANGTLNVQSGAAFTTTDTSTTYVGINSGITGSINVTGKDSLGAASTWSSSGSIALGQLGNGVLNVTDGGVATISGSAPNMQTILGNLFGSSGSATIRDVGSRWSGTSQTLVVGNMGIGSLAIDDEAQVTFGDVRVGQHQSGSGTIAISDGGSLLSYGGLYVGGTAFSVGGPGTVTIGQDAKVTVGTAPLFTTGTKVWTGGTLNLDAGTLETGFLELLGGSFNWSTGTVHLTGSPLLVETGGLFGAAVNFSGGQHLRATEVRVGNADDGTLSIVPGATVQADYGFSVGGVEPNSVGNGSVHVDGGVLTTNFVNTLGDRPGTTGVVNISNGGRYDVLGATGNPASFHIGRQGTGVLNILSGGQTTLRSQTVPTLGTEPGGQGTINIDGLGAELFIEVHTLQVGGMGQGLLNIVRGGRAILPNSAVLLGSEPGSHGVALVQDAGSMLSSNAVNVGQSGMGVLNVTGGGRVATGEINIALNPFSEGIATVSGVDSRISALNGIGYLIVGGAGHGTLLISGRGIAEANEIIIGDGLNSLGEVLVSGVDSQLIATDELSVGFNGNGRLTVADEAVIYSHHTEVNPTSFLGGNGLLNGYQTGVHGYLINQGTIQPGLSAGRLRLVGTNYTQTVSGRLEIDLGGLTPNDQHDVLEVVEGISALNGTLSIKLINGFMPLPGDSWFVLTSGGGVSGEFANIEAPTQMNWSVVYGQTYVWLKAFHRADFDLDLDLDLDDIDALVTAIAGMTHNSLFDLTGDGLVDLQDVSDWLAAAGASNLPSGNPYLFGDANLDGVVDGQDFIVWNVNKFNASAGWSNGDFNADGITDGADFIVWNTNKFTSADTARIANIPESVAFPIPIALWMVLATRHRVSSSASQPPP